ncbi:LOW QUALITY PROTEIN: HS12A-like protein, partial [Mya arenaria]
GKAGVDPRRLKLALEPECASVQCETLSMAFKGAVTVQGSQFMVVDLGGGTADISVHERKADGTLKEIHISSGGPWGGIFVDENYMKMLNELFGEKAITELRKTEMNDYFDVIREFEHKKRSFDTEKTNQLIVRISASLRDLAEKYSSKSLEERIGTLQIDNVIAKKGKDKLQFDTAIVKAWFERPIDLLMRHLKSILAEPKMRSVHTVILVGGFGESPYVQRRIKSEITGVRLIVPSEAGLTVLKGAVRFGLNPDIVHVRAGYRDFDEKKHPEEKKKLLNGEWSVPKCLNVYIRVIDEVEVNQQVIMKSIPTCEITLTSVYRTTHENPEYTTDPGCELLGTIRLECSKDIPLQHQVLETTFMFGDTELLVKKKNMSTGKVAYMDFECFK